MRLKRLYLGKLMKFAGNTPGNEGISQTFNLTLENYVKKGMPHVSGELYVTVDTDGTLVVGYQVFGENGLYIAEHQSVISVEQMNLKLKDGAK